MEFRSSGGNLIDLETVSAEQVPEDMRERFDATLAAQRAARATDEAARVLMKYIDAAKRVRNDFAAKFAPRFQRTRLQEVRAMIASSRPQLADAAANVPHSPVSEEAGVPRDQDEFLAMVRQKDEAIVGQQHQLRDLSTKLRKEREHVRVCERALMTATPPISHLQALREVSETQRLVASGQLPTAGQEFTPLSYLDALGHAQGRGDPNDFVRKQFRNGGFRRGASPVKQIPRFGIGAPEPKPVPVT
jgi:hypothetical protein